MMRKPAPRSLPELTRWTLLSSTLIDWLRLRSTKSSTKSAPDRKARLITLSTRDWSRRGISLSVPAFSVALAFQGSSRHLPSPLWGGSGWGARHRFAHEGDHPQPQERQHHGGRNEHRGIAEAGRQGGAEQGPH